MDILSKSKEKIFRAEIIAPKIDDQGKVVLNHYSDGYLHVNASGRIESTGNFKDLNQESLPAQLIDLSGKIVHPGFIDLHLHFPQTRIMGRHGSTLLDWLKLNVFPEEAKFVEANYSKLVAGEFLEQLLRNGTTTAMAYSSSHYQSTQTLFESAAKKGLRLVAGMTAMDQNCPDNLKVSPDKFIEQNRALIGEWHGYDNRLFYAMTPRFVPSCSDGFFKKLGMLVSEYQAKNLFVQSHISENKDEIAWVKELFPKSSNYAEVYDDYGLLGPKTILGHGIYLDKNEWQLLKARGCAIAHCPTSNMFLGSGMFSINGALENKVKVGLASDVGAGTSFSMWKTMASSYSIQKILGESISPSELFLRSTAYSGQILNSSEKLGSFSNGANADFVVFDPNRDVVFKNSLSQCTNLEDRLAFMMTSADDRFNDSVAVDGEIVWARAEVST